MDISRIANVISEQIHHKPQDLLNNYIESVGVVRFEDFSDYCLMWGIIITEDIFEEMLANNEKYVFTEDTDNWIPILLDEVEEELGI